MPGAPLSRSSSIPIFVPILVAIVVDEDRDKDQDNDPKPTKIGTMIATKSKKL